MPIVVVVCRLEQLQALGSGNKIPTLIRLAVPSDKPYAGYSGPNALSDGEKKKKVCWHLPNRDEVEDKKRFEVVQYEARKIKYTCDTNTIIKVHFNSNNKYGQFVRLVNMIREAQHKRYMYYEE